MAFLHTLAHLEGFIRLFQQLGLLGSVSTKTQESVDKLGKAFDNLSKKVNKAIPPSGDQRQRGVVENAKRFLESEKKGQIRDDLRPGDDDGPEDESRSTKRRRRKPGRPRQQSKAQAYRAFQRGIAYTEGAPPGDTIDSLRSARPRGTAQGAAEGLDRARNIASRVAQAKGSASGVAKGVQAAASAAGAAGKAAGGAGRAAGAAAGVATGAAGAASGFSAAAQAVSALASNPYVRIAIAAYAAVKALNALSVAGNELGRKYAGFSGSLGRATSMQDAARLRMDWERGQHLSGPGSKAIEARTRLENEMQPWKIVGDRISAEMSAASSDILASMLAQINVLTQIKARIGKAKDGPAPFTQLLNALTRPKGGAIPPAGPAPQGGIPAGAGGGFGNGRFGPAPNGGLGRMGQQQGNRDGAPPAPPPVPPNNAGPEQPQGPPRTAKEKQTAEASRRAGIQSAKREAFLNSPQGRLSQKQIDRDEVRAGTNKSAEGKALDVAAKRKQWDDSRTAMGPAGKREIEPPSPPRPVVPESSGEQPDNRTGYEKGFGKLPEKDAQGQFEIKPIDDRKGY